MSLNGYTNNMYILTLRTDRPDAEIGLYDDNRQFSYETWAAHRQLAETIHLKIKTVLAAQQLELHQLGGIIIYKGPGSFTGLRIGISVANALADSLPAKIVGTTEDDWIDRGLTQLSNGQSDKLVLPEYGALPNITSPRK